MWCQRRARLKKEKKKTLSIRNSCTAEDNCGRKSHIYSNSLLFLPPLYRPQRTNKHANKQPFCVRLSFFFHPFLHTMINPHILFAIISSFSLCSPRGWTAETVVFGWAAMFMCVFCPLLTSTKRCHGDTLSTLPVKAALTAAVLRTRRDRCSFLPPWYNTTHKMQHIFIWVPLCYCVFYDFKYLNLCFWTPVWPSDHKPPRTLSCT